MAHRKATTTAFSALAIGLLLGITGCGTDSAYSGGGASSPNADTGLSYSGSASNTAVVSWTPPTQRADGSALTDLAGYRVYYGKSLNAMSSVIDIRNPGQTSQFIENLDTGTWYFAVTAYTTDGLESGMSDLAAKRIL